MGCFFSLLFAFIVANFVFSSPIEVGARIIHPLGSHLHSVATIGSDQASVHELKYIVHEGVGDDYAGWFEKDKTRMTAVLRNAALKYFHSQKTTKVRLSSYARASVQSTSAGPTYPLHGYLYAPGPGLYGVEMRVGAGGHPYVLMFDTGSDEPWLHCNTKVPRKITNSSSALEKYLSKYLPPTCNHCKTSPGNHSNFRPSLKTQFVSCKSDECKSLQYQGSGKACRVSGKTTCGFEIPYGFSSALNTSLTISAYLISDIFKLVDSTATTYSLPVMFGCEYNESISYKFDGYRILDGILGMGQGQMSFATQSGASGFGYCMMSGGNGGGFAFFGDVPASLSSVAFASSDLVDTSLLYFIHMTGIKVGNKNLNLTSKEAQAALTFDVDNYRGGTFIDSGATFSYFVDAIFEPFLDAFLSQVKTTDIERATSSYAPYCWRAKMGKKPINSVKQVSSSFPSGSLSLATSSKFSFNAENMLFHVKTQQVVCLGISSSGSVTKDGAANLIGALFQSNKVINYDIFNARIQWANYNCSKTIS